MIVNLTYFKRTGKYYSEGVYITKKTQVWDIFDEVKKMLADGKLPDLVEGAKEFIVYVDLSNHPAGYPALILP